MPVPIVDGVERSCPPRRNGRKPRVVAWWGKNIHGGMKIRCVPWEQRTGRNLEDVRETQQQWDHFLPMDMDYSIWRGMCGNGCWTGIKPIRGIQKVGHIMEKPIACCGAARGTASVAFSALRIGSSTIQMLPTIVLVSGVLVAHPRRGLAMILNSGILKFWIAAQPQPPAVRRVDNFAWRGCSQHLPSRAVPGVHVSTPNRPEGFYQATRFSHKPLGRCMKPCCYSCILNLDSNSQNKDPLALCWLRGDGLLMFQFCFTDAGRRWLAWLHGRPCIPAAGRWSLVTQ
jgi:hypothetical protein